MNGPFSQQRIAGIPVLQGHTRGPGEPLDDGLVVPTGTVLLGEPLKVAHPLGNVRRWTGSFVVVGDLSAAIGDLRGQLAGRGHRVASSCERDGPAVSCTLDAVKDEPVGGRRLVHAEATRTPDPAASWLLVDMTAERPGSPAVRDWGSLIIPSAGPIHDVALPGPWTDLPTEGEPVFPVAPWAGVAEVRALTVPGGTSPLGPPVRARIILVQPRGRVARTFDALVRQARDEVGPTAMVTRAPDADEDGVRVRFAKVGERGGPGRLLVTALEQRGHPSYVVLEHSAYGDA